MLAFNPPLAWVYPSYVLSVFLVMVAIYWSRPDLRAQMRFMFICGTVGGLVVGAGHRVDFWNPPSWGDVSFLELSWSPWDALFGGSFSSITTILLQLAGWRLEKEAMPVRYRAEYRRRKVIQLTLVLLVAPMCYYLFRFYSPPSVAMAYVVGAFLFHWPRRNLRQAVFWGALTTLAVYGFSIGILLVVLGDPVGLATTMCSYYVKHGAIGTGFMLILYMLAYGAVVAPLYAWITNQRFVRG